MSDRSTRHSRRGRPGDSPRERTNGTHRGASIERVPLSAAMRAVVHQELGRPQLVVGAIAMVAGVTALVTGGLFLRELRDSTPQPSGQLAPLLGYAVVTLLAVVVCVWLGRHFVRMQRIARSVETDPRPCVRASGPAVLLATVKNRRHHRLLVTAAGDHLQINDGIFEALEPAAVSAGRKFDLKRIATRRSAGRTDVWQIERATILYHPAASILFEVRGPDGTVLYSDERYHPDGVETGPGRAG